MSLFTAAALAGQTTIVNSNATVKSHKRGLAVFVPGDDPYTLSADDFRAIDPGISWYYNWGILELEPPDDVTIDYVPMVWGAGSGAISYLDSFLAEGNNPPFVLGLNEPNLAWEANLTPQAAANTSIQIKNVTDSYGLALVAPQVTIGTDAAASITAYDPIQEETVTYTYQEPYLEAFNYYCGTETPFGQATHSYGGTGEVTWITGEMHAARPNQPVYITELNWSAAPSMESAVSNVITTVDYLERTPWIEGYAWFMARIPGDPKDSILADDSGQLTEVGEAYVKMPIHHPDVYYRLPGRLQGERYVTMSHHDIAMSTDVDGFADMVCYNNDSHLDYNVQIDNAGSYNAYIRVAGSGDVKIYKGTTLLATASASGSEWSTVPVSFNLTSTGTQTLRVVSSFGLRINYIDWITAAPPTPAALEGVAGDGKAHLSWAHTLNAAVYEVKRATSPGGTYTSLGTTEVESFTDEGLQNGTAYYYVVTAINELGTSGNSTEVAVVPTTNPLRDFGFENPSLSVGSYVSAPAGTAWEFSGSAGVSANSSGYTWANPVAPEGDQVAYLQSSGSMSQTLDNLDPGTAYDITFLAAQRQSWGGAQTWDVEVDGVVLGSFAPPQSSANYTSYTVGFVASHFAHTIRFVGTTTSDNTVFIDDVQVSVVPNPNLSFETPPTASVIQQPQDASWAFSGSSGISANGSGYTVGNPDAPDGEQVAYLQGAGAMEQAIAGFESGEDYTVRFDAALRANWGGPQTWDVVVNGNVVASFAPSPSATQYTEYTAQFTATGEAQTIAFVGTTTSDNTVLIDHIRIELEP